MANKNGIITRKDIVTDDTMDWGEVYAKNLKAGIEANKEFLDSVKQIAPILEKIQKANNNSQYIKAKNEEALATQRALNANKLLLQSEQNLEKIRQARLATEKKAIQTETERQKAQERTIKNTAREESAYQKLNRQRLEAQKTLANLLSSETKNTAAIIVAEREFAKLDARVKAVDAATKNYTKTIGNYKTAFTGFGSTASGFLSTFGIVTGAALAAQTFNDIINVIRDFDRQLIAVGKTINLRGEDLKQFGRDVAELGDQLDGVSIQGLLSSAEVAGQLGVTGTANILKFSRAIEELKLTSNIISDEQVSNFAKFIEVSSDSFENADRLGSVLTKLGNDFATTEAEALANATEIQKGISVYNNAASSVLGLGAATASLGSEAEASRSAIQTTFGVINNAIATGKGLQQILKLTGLTQQQLSKQFNQDATGVFVKFIKGLRDAKDNGENLSLVLSDVGIEEKRAFTVVGALAANYDVLNNAVNSATQEYQDNIALSQEVAAASQSLNSIIGDIRDQFEAYILSTNDSAGGTEKLAKALIFVRDNLKTIINIVIKLSAVLLTYFGIMKGINLVMTIYNALAAASNAAQIRFALSTGIGTRSILAQTQAIRAQTVAQNAQNIAMAATPWGIVLAALAAAVVAYQVFNDQLTQAEANQRRINDALEDQKNQIQENTSINNTLLKERIGAIEDEYNLKKARQGDSAALDKEEIASKKAAAQEFINANNTRIQSNLNALQKEKEASKARIGILTAERLALEKESNENGGAMATKVLLERAKNAENAARVESTIEINGYRERIKSLKEQNTAFNNDISELDKQNNLKKAASQAEADKKAIEARKKRLKAEYEAQKKAAEDEFKLRQFRIQNAIDLDDDLFENEKKSLQERLDASFDAEQFRAGKSKEAAEFELSQLGYYNEEKGKFFRQLSDAEITEIINTGKTKKKLTDEQQLIYEKYQKDLYEAAQKGAKDREKLAEDEAKKIAEIQQKQFEDAFNGLSEIEKERQKIFDVQAGNLAKQRISGQLTQKQYDDKLLELQNDYQKQSILSQFDYLTEQLVALAQTEDQKLKVIEERAKLRSELEEQNLKEFLQNEDKRKARIADSSKIIADAFGINADNLTAFLNNAFEQFTSLLNGGKFTIEDFKESSKLAFAVASDISNAFTDRRIEQIDREIAKSDEYYEGEIAKAGDDARKKAAIEKQQEAAREALEKKKRKAQYKQAVLEKAFSIAQAGINLSEAVTAALTAGPGVGLALAAATAVVAGAALAAAIATPLPKAYKMGRDGGKEEIAVVGDGGRAEVISAPDGSNPIITPSKPTWAHLQEGDRVHKSVEDYKRFMRNSTLAKIDSEQVRAIEYQTMITSGKYDKDLLDELKRNTDAVKKNRVNINNSVKHVDIPHQLWKMGITKWHNN